MIAKIFIVVLLQLILLPLTGFTQGYKKVSFFIVAHQDDWQLFMGEKAYKDVLDPKTKVVFIFVTSGEAGKDSIYWNNRDFAAKNCLYFIKEKAFKDSVVMHKSIQSFNNHPVKFTDYYNTRSYYMRLPDGHGRAGVGYEIYGSQSMKKFKAGQIPSMTTTDSTSTYNGWNDLVMTLKTMINEESKGFKDISVHFPEFDSAINANAHSDHIGTGQAVFEAVSDKKDIKKIAYVDYETQFKPENLSNKEVMIKSALYAVYDKSVFDKSSYCTICDGKGQYTQWLFRSYYRIIK